jgi:HK97 gp10 family phage protein
MVKEARRQVEKDSGELEDTIRYYEAPGSDMSIFRVVAGVNKAKGFYARFVEFGTRHMQAQPFFFTTYRAMKRSFAARNGRALKKASKRATKK